MAFQKCLNNFLIPRRRLDHCVVELCIGLEQLADEIDDHCRGPRVTLFAGCGVVADSDPAAELAESMWKLRPMLSALGADVADAA